MDFISYPKIETCFARDVEGSKKLMKGVYREKEVEVLCDLDWEWTEKIDGTNIQIRWDGHKVEFGGRTARANIPAHLVNYLNDTFGGNINEELFEQKFGETPVVLFGEGYGPKIQKGGNYRDDVSFILFDIKIGGFWLEREDVEDIARTFNIDVVPIIFHGPVSQAIDYVKTHPNSKVAAAHGKCYSAEGVVGRAPCGLKNRRGERIMVKVKWNDIKEIEESGRIHFR